MHDPYFQISGCWGLETQIVSVSFSSHKTLLLGEGYEKGFKPTSRSSQQETDQRLPELRLALTEREVVAPGEWSEACKHPAVVFPLSLI